MSKCFNPCCGYETFKALEICPRCDGSLTPVAGEAHDSPQIVVPVPALEVGTGE